MAVGYKLGKAYSLGLELSESMLAAYDACKRAGAPTSQLSDSFSADRIARMQQEIGDLKTSFQPYAADAVVSTVADFTAWINGLAATSANQKVPQAVPWGVIAKSNLYPQIVAWRSLLSGEKAATDVLTVADYVMALERLVSRYWVLARAFVLRWSALLVAIPIVALIAGGLYLLFKGQFSAAYAAVAASVGLSGISGATVVAAVKNALLKTEDNLWDAELGAAVALAIDHVPVQLPNSRVKALAAPRRKRK
jgi:hypothetical protein